MILSEFKKAHAGLGADAFCARYPHPFLVVVGIEGPADEKRAFQTVHLDVAALTAAKLGEPEIFAIHRAGAADGTMVTLGRTKNTDIFIDSPAVSKLHAFFQRDLTTRVFSVTDAGSRNGTTVNGVPLEAKVARPIKDGDVIDLAKRFRGTFFLPETLLKMLPTLG